MVFARFLIILLILINLLVLAAWQGWMGQGGDQGEPQRLTNQLHPDKIELLAERPAAAPPAPVPVPDVAPSADVPVSESAADSLEPPAVEVVRTDASAPVPASEVPAMPAEQADTVNTPLPADAPPACIAFAGLSDEQSALLMGDAQTRVGFDAKDFPSVDVTSWWVHIPSQGSREGATRKLAELRSQGVKDLFMVGEKGAHPYAISLGLFKSAESAAEQQRRLEKKGVIGIAIEERGPASHRVEVRAPAEMLTGWASDWSGRLPESKRLDCRP